ncbi:class I SAM-dependent methyltransferase [Bdellovibrio sp. SKB1291214]|uniref:class I SAM-dependent methyltransferase n=1 Tax=Bdellovibrio sp. SKB1291214 TaxID=1732569 RepID=UPI000B515397|nr:class I SAM-dependent methyltransferase [Bdellovibrio sp. SKB1291214]UYL09341.1 class I SAM-dependent methyltransferase [Bdellovibrio sp. SKB1291214]
MNFPNYWRHHSGVKVLEIGCGTGRHTKKWIEAGNTVVAIDMSPGMLAIARGKISSSKVTFVEGDFAAQKGLAHDFDVVVESLVLEHIQNLEDFFRQAITCLKTGGDLYLSEIHPERTLSGVGAHFKPQNSDEEVHLVSFAHTQNEIERVAAAVGFKLIHSKDVLGDRKLAEQNPKWARYLDKPLIKIWHFVKR